MDTNYFEFEANYRSYVAKDAFLVFNMFYHQNSALEEENLNISLNQKVNNWIIIFQVCNCRRSKKQL